MNQIVEFMDSYPYEFLGVKDYPFKEISIELIEHFHGSKNFIQKIPDHLGDYKYQPDKWSLKMVIGHLIDHQISFLHRAYALSRNDKTPIPGIDENFWANQSNYDEMKLESIQYAYVKCAEYFEIMFSFIPKKEYANQGVANGIKVKLEELIQYFILHEKHHLNFLKNNYGCDF